MVMCKRVTGCGSVRTGWLGSDAESSVTGKNIPDKANQGHTWFVRWEQPGRFQKKENQLSVDGASEAERHRGRWGGIPQGFVFCSQV